MKPALLVIDMQNDFKRDASPYACPIQHTIKPDKSDAERFEPAEVRACIEGAEGDGFFGSKLEGTIKKTGADTLLFCGVIVVADCCGAASTVEGLTAEELNIITLEDLKNREYETEILAFEELKRRLE